MNMPEHLEHAIETLRTDEIQCVNDDYLGSGSYSVVCLAFHKTRGAVAVKCTPLLGGHDDRSILEQKTIKEIGFLQKANHENIVRVYGWTHWPGYIAIVMEYLIGGNLKTFLLDDDVAIHPVLSLRFCYEICNGLAVIHNLGEGKLLVHGDIKPENILLTEELHCKISDFGGAKLRNYTMTSSVRTRQNISQFGEENHFTILYTPPEFLKNPWNRITRKHDVFAVGMTMHMIVEREMLVSEAVCMELCVEMIKNGKRPRLTKAHELKMKLQADGQDDSASLCELLEGEISKCWQQDPNDRPDMSVVRDRLHNRLVTYDSVTIQQHVTDSVHKMRKKPSLDSHNCVPLHQFHPLQISTTTSSICALSSLSNACDRQIPSSFSFNISRPLDNTFSSGSAKCGQNTTNSSPDKSYSDPDTKEICSDECRTLFPFEAAANTNFTIPSQKLKSSNRPILCANCSQAVTFHDDIASNYSASKTDQPSPSTTTSRSTPYSTDTSQNNRKSVNIFGPPDIPISPSHTRATTTFTNSDTSNDPVETDVEEKTANFGLKDTKSAEEQLELRPPLPCPRILSLQPSSSNDQEFDGYASMYEFPIVKHSGSQSNDSSFPDNDETFCDSSSKIIKKLPKVLKAEEQISSHIERITEGISMLLNMQKVKDVSHLIAMDPSSVSNDDIEATLDGIIKIIESDFLESEKLLIPLIQWCMELCENVNLEPDRALIKFKDCAAAVDKLASSMHENKGKLGVAEEVLNLQLDIMKRIKLVPSTDHKLKTKMQTWALYYVACCYSYMDMKELANNTAKKARSKMIRFTETLRSAVSSQHVTS